MYIDLGSLLTPLVEWHYVMCPNPFQLVHQKTWAESPIFFPFIFLDGSKSLPLPSLSVVYSLKTNNFVGVPHFLIHTIPYEFCLTNSTWKPVGLFPLDQWFPLNCFARSFFWVSDGLWYWPTPQQLNMEADRRPPSRLVHDAIDGQRGLSRVLHGPISLETEPGMIHVIACIFCCILHSVSFKTFMHMLCVL